MKQVKKQYADVNRPDPNDLLSYGKQWSIFIGPKRYGKTFSIQKYCINRYLLRSKKTIWFTRNAVALDLIGNFFDPLITEVNKGTAHFARCLRPYITIKKHKGYAEAAIDGEVFMTFIPLSVGKTYAGTSFKNGAEGYDLVVVDEFLANIYLKEKEDPLVFDNFQYIVATIFSLRPFRTIMLANPYTVASRWFDKIGIDFRPAEMKFKITTGKKLNWVLYYGSPARFRQRMKASAYGQTFKDSTLNQSAIEGDFICDNADLIVRPRETLKTDYIVGFKTPRGEYHLWFNQKKGWIVVSKVPSDGLMLTPDETSADAVSMLVKSQKGRLWYDWLRQARLANQIRYENTELMQGFLQLLDKFFI